ARNKAVSQSSGECFVVIDGSEDLPASHVAEALRTLMEDSTAAFAAASGGSLCGLPPYRSTAFPRIDAEQLVGSAWSIGGAVIRRQAFEEANGFDETLPALVDWDLLLTLTDKGLSGVRINSAVSRHDDDDVRL